MRSIDRAVVAVFGLSFGLRLAAVLWLADTIPFSDYFYYHEAGRMMAHDWRFLLRAENVAHFTELNWWPPGYPFFISMIYAIVGPRFRVAVFAHIVLGALTAALVTWTGRRVGGRGAGIAAGVLVALDPTYIFTTNLLASENLFALLFALGLELARRSRTASETPARGVPARRMTAPGWAALSGGALGLAALTRAAGLVLPIVIAGWLRRAIPSRAAANRSAVWVLAGCAVVLAPWTIRNAVVAGSPAIVCFGGGLNFYFGNNTAPPGYRDLAQTPLAGLHDPAVIDRLGWRLGLRFVATHPSVVLERSWGKLRELFAPPTYALHANSAILLPDATAQPELAAEAAAKRARQAAKDRVLHGPLAWGAALHLVLLLTGALATCLFGWRLLPDFLRLCVWICLAWIGIHLVFWAQPRFRYPMEIPMALLAGWGIAFELGRRWRSRAT